MIDGPASVTSQATAAPSNPANVSNGAANFNRELEIASQLDDSMLEYFGTKIVQDSIRRNKEARAEEEQ